MTKKIYILLLCSYPSFFIFGQTESKEISLKNNSYYTYSVKLHKHSLENFHIFPDPEQDFNYQTHEQVIDYFKYYYDSLKIDNSLFLTNPGIVVDGCEPIGLFVNNYNTLKQLNINNGSGNFYNLKPNGALLIKHNEAIVCKTADVPNHTDVRIAIQSGPMLVHDGIINAHFGPRSNNKYIRSGVGLFKDKQNYSYLIFAISKNPVSFYDFSEFFLEKFNCQNALCLESARSVMTIPYLNTSAVNSQERVCLYLYHKTKHGGATGTGFALTNDGLIATNYHVVEGATSIVVKGVNGDFTNSYKARVEVEDKQHDIALLRIEDPSFTSAGNPPYTLLPNIVDVGTSAFALGYPLRSTMGDEIKLTNGIISAKSGFNGDLNSYQISVAIQPGNSGGPLFNDKAEIIGITSAGHTTAQNANYAIKTNLLLQLIGMMNTPPKLPVNNTISTFSMVEQVKVIKNFVYSIEVSY